MECLGFQVLLVGVIPKFVDFGFGVLVFPKLCSFLGCFACFAGVCLFAPEVAGFPLGFLILDLRVGSSDFGFDFGLLRGLVCDFGFECLIWCCVCWVC